MAKLNDILSKEEMFWRQKSQEVWLSAGDRNTKYFHNATKARREANKIKRVRDKDGRLLEDVEEVKQATVVYF